MAARRRFVAQETHLWATAIGNPQVEVAVEVPVAQCNGTTIVWKIESADGRDVGKLAFAEVKKTTMALMAAEGSPCAHHLIKRGTHRRTLNGSRTGC